MIKLLISSTAAAAVLTLTSAMFFPVASAQTVSTPGPASTPGKNATSGMSGGMDMKAMMKDNNDKMSSMAMTGNADVDFAMMMRIHHQGAIDMAQAELRDGKDPKMRKMAQDIIAAQKKEIAQFDKFLANKGHSMEKSSK